MLVKMLVNNNGTIQEIDLGTLNDSSNTTINNIYFGQKAIQPSSEEDAKGNALIINELPAYSAEVWLHFIKEDSDSTLPHFNIYMIPKISSDPDTVATDFTSVKLYRGYTADAPTTIVEDGVASTISSLTQVTDAEANQDPDAASATWINIASDSFPYSVLQLQIVETPVQELKSKFYFKVEYSN